MSVDVEITKGVQVDGEMARVAKILGTIEGRSPFLGATGYRVALRRVVRSDVALATRGEIARRRNQLLQSSSFTPMVCWRNDCASDALVGVANYLRACALWSR